MYTRIHHHHSSIGSSHWCSAGSLAWNSHSFSGHVSEEVSSVHHHYNTTELNSIELFTNCTEQPTGYQILDPLQLVTRNHLTTYLLPTQTTTLLTRKTKLTYNKRVTNKTTKTLTSHYVGTFNICLASARENRLKRFTHTHSRNYTLEQKHDKPFTFFQPMHTISFVTFPIEVYTCTFQHILLIPNAFYNLLLPECHNNT